jgi:hypothetical protein
MRGGTFGSVEFATANPELKAGSFADAGHGHNRGGKGFLNNGNKTGIYVWSPGPGNFL